MSPELPKGRQASTGNGSNEPKEVRIVGGVSHESPPTRDTADQAFWSRLRTSSELLSFPSYEAFIDDAFCALLGDRGTRLDRAGKARAALPFPDVQSYRALKGATEVFMELACGVRIDALDEPEAWEHAYLRDASRLGLDVNPSEGPATLQSLWERYITDEDDEIGSVIPYLIEVRGNLKGTRFRSKSESKARAAKGLDGVELCEFLIEEKFKFPCLVELIWSYWHEQGLLVRSMDAISRRFQNRGARNGREPLAELEITPLRPLNNLLWGYIQDEQHRLTAERRLYEYNHHYGLRPAAGLQPADSRSRFLDALHQLIQKCAAFFKEDDDTTVKADAFPILNALREVHILLAEGAHNQFGDLPWTSRMEMLMEQWLLARPEFDEFLPSRKAVVFPERWMHRVEAMKRLHRWEQPSVRHFNNLARYGELLLLSIRYGNWGVVDDVDSARNWARSFRQELQWYTHSYQAVTGVDLSSGMVDVRQAAPSLDRGAQPSVLMQPSPARAALGPAPARQPMRRPVPKQLRP
jgi:hypothetical protein